jgi:hypothetical protein
VSVATLYRGVPVAAIKRHIAGKGSAHKEAGITAVRTLGFVPADRNEVNALTLLDRAIVNRFGGGTIERA